LKDHIVYSIFDALGTFFVSVFIFLYDGHHAAKKDESYAPEYGIDGANWTVFLLVMTTVDHLIDQITGMPAFHFDLLLRHLVCTYGKV